MDMAFVFEWCAIRWEVICGRGGGRMKQQRDIVRSETRRCQHVKDRHDAPQDASSNERNEWHAKQNGLCDWDARNAWNS